jgi:hypothetical protein
MEDLMNYKIIMDYASQEVKRLEGSKISDPFTFDRALGRLRTAKSEFIRAMNKFTKDNFSDELHFNEEN